MSQTELFIGVDVSKKYLDVAFGHREDAPVERIQNTPDQVAQLVARLQQLQPVLIVLESTGSYERLLLTRLGCRSRRCSPSGCAPLPRRRGYTDRLDARLLARFGARMRPAASKQADEKLQIMDELAKRREQLMQMRTAELNRLKTMMLESISGSTWNI